MVRSSNVTFGTAPTFAGGAGGQTFPVGADTAITNAYGTASGGGAATTVPFAPTTQSLFHFYIINV